MRHRDDGGGAGSIARRKSHLFGWASRIALDGLQRIGVDGRALCHHAGLRYTQMSDAEALVPEASVRALWREAERRWPDPCLGLRAGAAVGAPFFAHLFMHLCLSSRDLEDVISRAQRFQPLVGGTPGVWLRREGARTFLDFTPIEAGADTSRHEVEFYMVVIAHTLNFLFRLPWIHEVHFTHHTSGALEDYRRALGAPARFGQRRNRFVVLPDALHRPFPHYSASMVQVLEREAERVVAASSDSRVTVQVRRAIELRLGTTLCCLPVIAQGLYTSVRTLQRRLRAEGTSFEAVLDVCRRETALPSIEAGVPLSEIADRVGFADVRALARAVLRWTGRRPRAYRVARGIASDG